MLTSGNLISGNVLDPLVSVPRSVTLSALIMSWIDSRARLCPIKNNRYHPTQRRKQRVISRER